MPVLKNSKHEKFCQLVANGLKHAAAYLRVYGGTKANARARAAELVAKRSVSDRLDELKKGSDEDCRLSRREELQWLVDVILTPVGDLDQFSPLVQEVHFEKGRVAKIKMASKMDAIREINKMCARYAPEKLEHSADDEFTEILRAVSQGKA